MKRERLEMFFMGCALVFLFFLMGAWISRGRDVELSGNGVLYIGKIRSELQEMPMPLGVTSIPGMRQERYKDSFSEAKITYEMPAGVKFQEIVEFYKEALLERRWHILKEKEDDHGSILACKERMSLFIKGNGRRYVISIHWNWIEQKEAMQLGCE